MSENVEFSSLSSIKSCPICGQGLRRGYLTSGGAIVWDIRKYKYFMRGGEALKAGMNGRIFQQ